MLMIIELLYFRSRYTYAELTTKPLPEGVASVKLDSYLSDEEF